MISHVRIGPLSVWLLASLIAPLFILVAHNQIAREIIPAALSCQATGENPLPHFTEITTEMGLADVMATAVRAGDIDGDDYPDLITTIAIIGRRSEEGEQLRRVFLNRPQANDPSHRVFVDFTDQSGLLATRDGIDNRGFSTINLGDIDNDGDLDVIACPATVDSEDPCAAFLNDGQAHFSLAPVSALEASGVLRNVSGALLDFDKDGNLDFWPANYGQAPLLFRGLGDGRFLEVASDVGLPTVDGDPALHMSFRQTQGVSACDIDSDGDLDVLLADTNREANQLWRNDDGTFTEVGQAFGIAFDNRMDFQDNQSYMCYCRDNPEVCDLEVAEPIIGCPGRGWTPGISDQPWRLGGNTFSFSCSDIDNDGDFDLMSAEIRHWDVGSSSDPSELLINPGNGEAFIRPGNNATGLIRLHEELVWDEGDQVPVLLDIDLDGRKDIFLTSSDYLNNQAWLWRQLPDGTFEDVTDIAGVGQAQGQGVVFADFDLDGDLDLVLGTSTFRGYGEDNSLHFYRNDIDSQNNWIRIRLKGRGVGFSNTSAIGAKVWVTAGGVTQLQEVSGGYGVTTVQHDVELTFGLGKACRVEQIRVQWPNQSARIVNYGHVWGNSHIEIQEGRIKIRRIPH